MSGKVYLVGAGPGDPGLLTVKGLKLLARADVIVYDQLAGPELLKEARPDAEIIYVGKKAGDHTLPQGGINQLLVDKARAGLTVVRLKGGDPFVFGRGGEEAEALAAAGVPFEVVPGVTSAVAVPAYAGIPVTHRAHTTLVTFITGHEDPTKAESTIPWDNLGQNPGTLVFLMGVKNLAENCRRLVEAGRSAATPAAVIQSGTLPGQRTVTGTLSDIAARAQGGRHQPPAILVVGGVVELRQRLAWWEKRPLFGKTAVVTRTREQASALVELLSEAGARCLEIPTLEIAPPDDFGPLDAALARLADYQWLVFTSANGVAAFFQRLFDQGLDVRALGRAKLAAIGPATAQALRAIVWWPRWCRPVLWPRTWPRPCCRRSPPAPGCSWPGPRPPGRCCPKPWPRPGFRWRWPRYIRPGSPPASPRRPGPSSSPAGSTSSPSPVRPRCTISPRWWAGKNFRNWPKTPWWPPSAPSPRPASRNTASPPRFSRRISPSRPWRRP
jgi:uroporphyrinogen III methyltransferase / synthase